MPYPGLRVRVTGSMVVIQPLESTGDQVLSLAVDFKNGGVDLASRAPIKNECLVVPALIGVMRLASQAVVALVTESTEVACVDGHPIFQVTQTKVVEADRWNRKPGDSRYLNLLKSALDPEVHGSGLYFSPGINLTLNAERRSTLVNDRASQDKPHWAREDLRFFWNHNLCSTLIEANAHGFIYPLVQGFVGQLQNLMFRNKDRWGLASITLIARRSTQRLGTRHWRRGADRRGQVANFVETEQLVNFDNGRHISSFVQIRGSIPLLWTQIPNIKYKPPTEIAPRDAYSPAFDQHMTQLLEIYKDVDCLNLANQHGTEGRLSAAFTQETEQLSRLCNGLRIVSFDFHKECKGMRFERVSLLWHVIKSDFQRFGSFRTDADLVKRRQSGIFRTNCIDCLDRTNVVQGMLGRKALEAFLESLDFLDSGDQLSTVFPNVEQQFKILWADHGDEISMQYAGTGALKSGFTRTGKRTYGGMIDDGIKSTIRYYLNNFQDGKKQDALDVITGNHKISDKGPPTNAEKPSPSLPILLVVLLLSYSVKQYFTFMAGSGGSIFQATLPAMLAVGIVAALVKFGTVLVNKPQLQPELVRQW